MPQTFTLPKQVVIDPVTGNPAPGAKAYFYITGTSTPKPVYSDDELTIPITQPIIADSAGVFQVIYLAAEGEYKLTLTRSDDTLLYTTDPLGSITGITVLSTQIKYNITDAETAAGVTPTDYRKEPGFLRRYGGDPDSADNAVAINKWFSVAEQTGYALLEPEVFQTSGEHSVSAAINIICAAGGGTWVSDVGRIVLNANAAHLLKFNNLVTSISSVKTGGKIDGVVLSGGGYTVSDALLVIEGFSTLHFVNGGIHSCIGNGVRARIFWEGRFQNYFFRDIDAGSTDGVFFIDSRYNNDNNLNVNNLRFSDCHFENNLGQYFKSKYDSRLDVLSVTNSKFEWGRSSIPSGGAWSIFEIQEGTRVDIHHNHFTNFKATNKYSVFLTIGHTSSTNGADVRFKDNSIAAHDSTTYLASLLTGGRCIIEDNTKQGNSNTDFLIANTSASGPVLIEQPREIQDTADAPGTSSRTRLFHSNSLISCHELFSAQSSGSGYSFAAKTGTRNIAGTCIGNAGSQLTLIQIPLNWFVDFKGTLKLGVRCISASGAGTIRPVINTTTFATQTVPAAMGVLWWEITSDYLAVMGDSGSDRFRIQTGAANAELVSVDGVYLALVPEMDELRLTDGVTAPPATAGVLKLYVDSSDGDLKVIFGDGTIKTISFDT